MPLLDIPHALFNPHSRKPASRRPPTGVQPNPPCVRMRFATLTNAYWFILVLELHPGHSSYIFDHLGSKSRDHSRFLGSVRLAPIRTLPQRKGMGQSHSLRSGTSHEHGV